MTSKRAGILFGLALFPSNTPLNKRLEILKPHFQPRPGELSEIDAATLRDKLTVTKDVGRFGGSIRVRPPKGHCFVITTSSERADLKVCRETPVRWALDDINLETGTIDWKIKTGASDFGTPVSWKVPYVIAKVLPPEAEFFMENSTPVYFKSCTASIGDKKLNPRKITLTKFDNTKWVLRLPETDERIKTLNESRPVEVWGHSEPPKSTKEEKPAAVSTDPHGPNAHGDGHGDGHAEPAKAASHGDGHSGGHGDNHASAPPTPAPEPPKQELEPWTIDAGRAFEMSVENFISDVSMPPGRKGSCRYVFDYIPGNFERGRFECHDTGQYRYVYGYLPCIGKLAPKELRRQPEIEKK